MACVTIHPKDATLLAVETKDMQEVRVCGGEGGGGSSLQGGQEPRGCQKEQGTDFPLLLTPWF